MRECIQYHEEHPHGSQIASAQWEGGVLDDAYKRAGIVTAEYAKTFYLGTKLMTPEKARAVWAIYVWCRRTDELVDGPNASHITPEVRRHTARLSSIHTRTNRISRLGTCAASNRSYFYRFHVPWIT